MEPYSEDTWVRAMKVKEVILRAMARHITSWQAAEIIGSSYVGYTTDIRGKRPLEKTVRVTFQSQIGFWDPVGTLSGTRDLAAW
jgi:hypothetical protein